MGYANLTCTEYDLLPNPDIDGIGVILSVFLSAWMSFLFYLVVFFAFETHDMSRLDHLVIKNVRKVGKYLCLPFLKWLGPISLQAVQKVALVVSDQQLITCASIFIAVFPNVDTISEYHFRVAYGLGAASVVTHQSTVMLVGNSLQDRPFMRIWRMVWLTAVFAFVIVSNLITYGFTAATETSGLAVLCSLTDFGRLLSEHFSNPNIVVTFVISSLLWVWGFYKVSRVLCPEGWVILDRLLHPILRGIQQPAFLSIYAFYRWILQNTTKIQSHGITHYGWLAAEKLTFIPFLICFTIHQVFNSNLKDLCRVGISLWVTTFTICKVRVFGYNVSEEVLSSFQAENTWALGQIMPLLLLALPFFQVLEMLYEDGRNPKRPNHEDASDSEHSLLEMAPMIPRDSSSKPPNPSISRTSTEGGSYTLPLYDDDYDHDDPVNADDLPDFKHGETEDILEEIMYRSTFFHIWIGLLGVGTFGLLAWMVGGISANPLL